MPTPRKTILTAIVLFCLAAGFQTTCFLIGRAAEPRLIHAIENRLQVDAQFKEFKFNCLTGISAQSLLIGPKSTDKSPENSILIKKLFLRHSLADIIFGNFRVKSVEIKQVDASAKTPFLKKFSDLSKFYTGKKLPEIKIDKAFLDADHRFFKNGIQFKDISVKTIERQNIVVDTTACFDKGKNPVRGRIIIIPEKMAAEAQLSVDKFDPAALDYLNLPSFVPDSAIEKINERLSGRILANYFHETTSFVFSQGRFKTQNGRIEISSAGIDFEKNKIKEAWIKAEARKINLSVLDIFDTSGFLPEKFRPEIKGGTFNAKADVNWNPSAGIDCYADAVVESGSAVLPELETEIDLIDADINISFPGRIHIRQCRGFASGGRIQASGHISWDKAFLPRRPFLEIDLTGVKPNNKIKAQLPVGVQKAVDRMELKSPGVNGRIIVSPGNTELDLDVYAETAKIPDLPFLLENPSASIFWKTGLKTVDFDKVESRLQGKPVKGSGVLHITKPVCADFTFFGRHLPVTDEILKWLSVDTGSLNINGGYDLELRARKWRSDGKQTLGKKGLEASVDIRDLNVTHPVYGKIADTWYGHLSVDENGLRLADFRGNIFNTGVVANGIIPVNGGKPKRLRVESKTIYVDRQFYKTLPQEFAETLEKFQVRGQIEIQADLKFLSGEKLPSSANVTAVIHHMETRKGSVILGANGSLRVDISDIGTRDIKLDGYADLGRIKAGRLNAEQISASFRATRKLIKIPSLKISAYGGTIKLADTVFDPAEMSWDTSIIPAHMDVETIVSNFGIAGRSAPAGSLRGQIRLKGKGLDPEALEGSGEIKIDRGRLYQFPILASVFRVLDFQMPRQSPVTDAYGTFRIKNGKFDLRDLLLLGGTVPMHVSGSVDLKKNRAFKDQSLNLLVTTAKTNGLLNKIPVISWIKHYTIDWFRKLAFQARVTGTIGDYEVQRLASPVTTPIERMWSLMEMLSPSYDEK